MSNAIVEQRPQKLLSKMAERYSIDPDKLIAALQETAFKGASPAQFQALCLVSFEYGLNPLLKEIYAFPSQSGIVPMVSVDGWIRIVNEHPQFKGLEFNYGPNIERPGHQFHGLPEWIECVIWRKDRELPTRIAEYMEECNKGGSVWKQVPRRFLRHRSLIQCARIAFGFSGIHDEGDPWEPAPTAAVLPAATQADRIKGKLGVPATAREVVDATPAVREVVETPVQARRPSESDEPPDDVALPPFEEGGR